MFRLSSHHNRNYYKELKPKLETRQVRRFIDKCLKASQLALRVPDNSTPFISSPMLDLMASHIVAKAGPETVPELQNVVQIMSDYAKENGISFVKETKSDLTRKLEESIKQYERLEVHYVRQGKDTKAVKQLTELLRKQLEGQHNVIPKGKKPGYEEVQTGLKEIFTFYSRQQVNIGKTPTFEVLDQEFNRVSLGSFVKFCVDFGIPIRKEKATELFKKYARLGKDLPWNYFQVKEHDLNPT